jgi:small membrane protein
LIVLLYIYLLKLPKRKKFYGVLYITFLCGIMAVFVFFPEMSNAIAQKLGVGRGADLLFYLFNMFVMFILLQLYLAVKKNERAITELVQYLALLKKDKP